MRVDLESSGWIREFGSSVDPGCDSRTPRSRNAFASARYRRRRVEGRLQEYRNSEQLGVSQRPPASPPTPRNTKPPANPGRFNREAAECGESTPPITVFPRRFSSSNLQSWPFRHPSRLAHPFEEDRGILRPMEPERESPRGLGPLSDPDRSNCVSARKAARLRFSKAPK